jgi:hypothetical protein
MRVMSRLYSKILRDLIEEDNKDEEKQSGFRTGRSCTDIFCKKQVIEKRNATNQETHLLFVDLTKAYDSTPISKFMESFGRTIY